MPYSLSQTDRIKRLHIIPLYAAGIIPKQRALQLLGLTNDKKGKDRLALALKREQQRDDLVRAKRLTRAKKAFFGAARVSRASPPDITRVEMPDSPIDPVTLAPTVQDESLRHGDVISEQLQSLRNAIMCSLHEESANISRVERKARELLGKSDLAAVDLKRIMDVIKDAVKLKRQLAVMPFGELNPNEAKKAEDSGNAAATIHLHHHGSGYAPVPIGTDQTNEKTNSSDVEFDEAADSQDQFEK